MLMVPGFKSSPWGAGRLLLGLGLCAIHLATSGRSPPIPTGPEIHDIQRGAANEVYAMVPRFGVFRRTADQAWTKVLGDDGSAWGRIFRRPDGTLMLSNFFGGPVHVSADAGLHWTQAGVSERLPELDQIHAQDFARRTAFCANGDAYVLPHGALLFSGDGGITWQRHALPPQTLSHPAASQSLVANGNVAFLLSGGVLYKSEDKGSHWRIVEQAVGAASPIAAGIDGEVPELRFGPDGALLALGPMAVSQKIEVSTDHGKSWHADRFGFDDKVAFWIQLFGPEPDAAYFFVRPDPPSPLPSKALYRKPVYGPAVEIAHEAVNVRNIRLGADGKLYMVLSDPYRALESVDGGRSWKEISHEAISRY